MIIFQELGHYNLVRAYAEGISAEGSLGHDHEFTYGYDPALETTVECDEPEGPMRALVLGFRGWRPTAVHDTCTCEQYDCQHFTRLMQLNIVTRLLEIALAQVEKQAGGHDEVIGRLLKLANIDEKLDQFLKDVLPDTPE